MGVLANHVPSIEQLKPGLVEIIDEAEYLRNISHDRRKVLKLGYVSMKHPNGLSTGSSMSGLSDSLTKSNANEDSNSAQFEKELARGINENEEGEEP